MVDTLTARQTQVLKSLIDEYIEAKIFKVLIKIGHPKGTFYPTTQNKILKDYEGIICQRV